MTQLKLVEIKNNVEEINEICETAQTVLKQNHGIKIAIPEAIATVAYVFLKEAMDKVASMKQKDEEVSIDLMGLFDLGVSHSTNSEDENDGNYVPFLIPGVGFKVAAKNDDSYEDEEEESEEE